MTALGLLSPSGILKAALRDWSWADAPLELVKAIVAIEPSGAPCLGINSKDPARRRYRIIDVPLTYDPTISPLQPGEPPLQQQRPQYAASNKARILQRELAGKFTNLSNVSVLGSHASHDEFTVRFSQRASAEAEHLKLADEGVHRNGHLQFLEMNNLDISALLERWISKVPWTVRRVFEAVCTERKCKTQPRSPSASQDVALSDDATSMASTHQAFATLTHVRSQCRTSIHDKPSPVDVARRRTAEEDDEISHLLHLRRPLQWRHALN